MRRETCCAERRIPQSDRVRELSHIACVIQWAFATLFQENEAVTTPVTAIHYMLTLAA